LILSVAYIKKELSYDRFHENADRIVRFSMQYNNEPIDGRNYGFSKNSPILSGTAGIEDVVFMDKVNTGLLMYQNDPYVINDFFFASSNFFEVFSFKLLEGDKSSVLSSPEKVVVSRQYARKIFGEESPIGKEIYLSGRKFNSGDKALFISGVFEDFPENSHFHTDMIIHRADNLSNDWAYVYLLLDRHTDVKHITHTISTKLNEIYADSEFTVSPYILPMTDIRLHGHLLRELEHNGNITYIYLVAGANILLLLIVLFNLWLNSGLIFSFNKKYYQLLRLNGASSAVVLIDEGLLSLLLGGLAVIAGGIISFFLFPILNLESVLTNTELAIIALLFLLLASCVSLLPSITRISSTLFMYNQESVNTSNFTLSKVKYMLIAQYSIVMLVVIIGFGISKQINLIQTSQVGGNDNTILVMKEQPDVVKTRYDIFKNELLKYPEINAVTSAMQLPGSAIRDMIQVRLEGESEDDYRRIPLLVVGDDFLPFFNIKPIAGTVFKPTRHSYEDEERMLFDLLDNNSVSNLSEEYVINRKALQLLGLNSPEDAIGKIININHNSIHYFTKGQIVGVTDDFNYTTSFEESMPQIILQRKMFQHCIMVHMDAGNTQLAMNTFNRIWNDIYPDYPADYTFLQDVYADVYHNELKAESLVRIFSLLCLIVANLGLIIITSFVIKRKTKEIGVRKVNGATPMNIIRMLNNRFVLWIGIAFVIAIPCGYLAMQRWLEHFANKIQIDGWIYAFAGLLVLSLSMISISWQSWQAAMLNPIKALKTE